MNAPEELKIRPYARLLTMLGDQLIKNERIALIEIIKNSYDADADWVKLSFCNFNKDFEKNNKSKIIMEDNGDGMDDDIIINHWLNPATPEKKHRKRIQKTTPKGRIIQGEKGIGRFALLKLGKTIKIFTKKENENMEYIIDLDFSQYDSEFLKIGTESKDLYLDELSISLSTQNPKFIKKRNISLGIRSLKRESKGTRIEITNLKGIWTEKKVEEVYRDVAKLQSIFSRKISPPNHQENSNNFAVYIYKDNKNLTFQEDYREKLNFLLDERAVIRVENGYYDEGKGLFKFKLNDIPSVLKLRDPEIAGLRVFKDHFGHGEKLPSDWKTDCGPFQFEFFVFDFSPSAPTKYELDKEDKKIIRNHRIYLYRDGIRVYPYGESDDDWLRIDMYRGTIAAGHFLSNDQVVGYVRISQQHNPRLLDKTNREGLIEEGRTTGDFLALLRVILRYIRQKPYALYKEKHKDRKAQDSFQKEKVKNSIGLLIEVVKKNKAAIDLLSKLENEYKLERKYLIQRAETTEELAGVGLSVETASHDIMAIMEKALFSIDSIIKDTLYKEEFDHEELQNALQSLRGMLSYIEAQLKDIQLLFKSSKQRRRHIKIKNILEKVERIYRGILKKKDIKLLIQEIGSPLIAKTTDAVLLQLFINLFDNSVYWFQTLSIENKLIEITLDGKNGQLIFSDNGPGVEKEAKPYIFEPFYSGKGEDGRGLGLYIARQLLERHDYSIELAELKADKMLSGANFVVSFVPKE
ncbi:ATP-binding protein [Acidobacteriota bacterium]